MKQMVQIAIDGPVGAGKGTVARLVAERLGILYVDTGAMYRAAALIAKRAGVSGEDEVRIAKLVDQAKIELRQPQGEERDGRLITVIVDNEDVSWKIRTEEMSQGSAVVSKHPQVRAVLVQKQQTMAKKQSVIMEGRDIAYRVLPEANLKIYLTADEQERARRRFKQMQERGIESTFEKVLLDIKWRDAQDFGRKTDPLKMVKGAWLLDTTGMTIEGVVDKIVRRGKNL
ncbi:cytidylate kinase [Microgenomates group bacterium RBG_16_45_19]|nr:MAG: cytidylate kinase [Microgenomates group bacterium RBG_16_45_19]